MRTLVKSTLAGIVLAAGLLAAPAKVEAVPFTFSCISGDPECAIEGQLSVNVTGGTNLSGNYVEFLFANNVGTASSITDIYFDEPDDDSLPMTLLSIVGGIAPGAVSYSQGAAPPNLPDGNLVGFSADHSFDSNAPNVVASGINANTEFLLLTFLLTGGNTFETVITSLSQIGGLAIGMHVQSISPTGGSASFVNNTEGGNDPPPVVPEPATMLLLGTGLAGVAAAARRRRRQQAKI